MTSDMTTILRAEIPVASWRMPGVLGVWYSYEILKFPRIQLIYLFY